jgi:hypothetical protein
VVVVVLAVFASTPAADRATLGTFAILLAAILSARGLDALSRFGGPGAALAPLAVTTLAAAVSLALFSGWATLGLLCGALTSATAVCLLLGLKFPTQARDASLPAATLLAVIAASGAHFTDPPMPPAAAVLLAVAPCGGALAVGLLARRGATLRLVLRAAGGAAIPAGIATAIAAHASP